VSKYQDPRALLAGTPAASLFAALQADPGEALVALRWLQIAGAWEPLPDTRVTTDRWVRRDHRGFEIAAVWREDRRGYRWCVSSGRYLDPVVPVVGAESLAAAREAADAALRDCGYSLAQGAL
jgi:hypothetical protein